MLPLGLPFMLHTSWSVMVAMDVVGVRGDPLQGCGDLSPDYTSLTGAAIVWAGCLKSEYMPTL